MWPWVAKRPFLKNHSQNVSTRGPPTAARGTPRASYRYPRVFWCPWTCLQHYFDILHTSRTHIFTLKWWEDSKCRNLALYALIRGSGQKNVIFHDFFKLLLNVPRCYPTYVEMFLGPLEGFFEPQNTFLTRFQASDEMKIFSPNSVTSPILG